MGQVVVSRVVRAKDRGHQETKVQKSKKQWPTKKKSTKQSEIVPTTWVLEMKKLQLVLATSKCFQLATLSAFPKIVHANALRKLSKYFDANTSVRGVWSYSGVREPSAPSNNPNVVPSAVNIFKLLLKRKLLSNAVKSHWRSFSKLRMYATELSRQQICLRRSIIRKVMVWIIASFNYWRACARGDPSLYYDFNRQIEKINFPIERKFRMPEALCKRP